MLAESDKMWLLLQCVSDINAGPSEYHISQAMILGSECMSYKSCHNQSESQNFGEPSGKVPYFPSVDGIGKATVSTWCELVG
jgi:hypothetical protein